MAKYSQGSVVSRYGTLGVGVRADFHPVLVLAVNDAERFHGEQLYTCIPMFSTKPKTGCSFQIDGKWADLNLLHIASENTFVSRDGGDPLIAGLDEKEIFLTREYLGRHIRQSKGVAGTIRTSATPSHDGVRGKINRPYVCLGELGLGSGKILCMPCSSKRGVPGSGFEITGLEEAGLKRDAEDHSYVRGPWMSTIDVRTSSKPCGKLTEQDNSQLRDCFAHFKNCLIAGEIKPMQKKEAVETIDCLAAGIPHRDGCGEDVGMQKKDL